MEPKRREVLKKAGERGTLAALDDVAIKRGERVRPAIRLTQTANARVFPNAELRSAMTAALLACRMLKRTQSQ